MVDMREPAVSVIMPVYNAERYVWGAVQSVVKQSYGSWELIIVDDGSTDGSRDVVSPAFEDSRIIYLPQSNMGVSAARNTGLDRARGDWVCFLDADDELYPDSLRDRLELVASEPKLHFVDGVVRGFNESMDSEVWEWAPTHRGPILDALLFDTASCFVGITWLVRNPGNLARFQVGLTHGEDLLFFIMNSGLGAYGYVDSPTVRVRRGHASAMTNLRGLELGYRSIYATVKERVGTLTAEDLRRLRRRFRRILVRSYLKRWRLLDAVRVGATL
ncbi:MAG: glycosyltransferase family 2 protein [Fimbriimonadaceae bacterium]|nr:glycosyltransferase family 2 protein [Fimbriimonadaceae bacterium]